MRIRDEELRHIIGEFKEEEDEQEEPDLPAAEGDSEDIEKKYHMDDFDDEDGPSKLNYMN